MMINMTFRNTAKLPILQTGGGGGSVKSHFVKMTSRRNQQQRQNLFVPFALQQQQEGQERLLSSKPNSLYNRKRIYYLKKSQHWQQQPFSRILSSSVVESLARSVSSPSSRFMSSTVVAGGSGSSSSGRKAVDPTAKRPNKVCDPYGQNGKPLSYHEAYNNLQTIVDKRWTLEFPPSSSSTDDDDDDDNNNENENKTPISIHTEFHHSDFYKASKFLSQIAALAHNHNHYPILKLERKLLKKKKCWKIITTIDCTTTVLGGLSYHDFHLAMLIDVEVDRDEVRDLWIREEEDDTKRLR